VEVHKAVIITKQRQRLREKHIELTLTVLQKAVRLSTNK